MSVTSQHYVEQPSWLKYIRIAQAFLSFIILALCAFALSAIPYGNTFGTFGFNIFTCIFTFTAVAYTLVTPAKAVHLYNCWAALVLEIFGVIFWLSAFGTLASWSSLGLLTTLAKRDAKESSSSSVYDADYGRHQSEEIEQRYERYRAGWRCAAAAAGLGGIVWVLFMITLITFSIFLHRHRMNPNNKNLPDNGSPAVGAGANVTPKDHEMGSVGVNGQAYSTAY